MLPADASDAVALLNAMLPFSSSMSPPIGSFPCANTGIRRAIVGKRWISPDAIIT